MKHLLDRLIPIKSRRIALIICLKNKFVNSALYALIISIEKLRLF